MAPDQPPLPTPMNLRFQPSAGIHTSILISESEVGRMVAATRQKAGSPRNAALLRGVEIGKREGAGGHGLGFGDGGGRQRECG